jgi:hypothetical protein
VVEIKGHVKGPKTLGHGQSKQMFRSDILRLKARSRHESIGIRESIRGVNRHASPRYGFSIGFDSPRYTAGKIQIAAKTAEAERIRISLRIEHAKKGSEVDGALQTRVEIGNAERELIARHALI